MENREFEYAKIVFLDECRFWPRVAIMQGTRLLKISKTLKNLNSELISEFDDIKRDQLGKKIEKYTFYERMYDEYTLIAMNRAIFFLDKAADYFEVFRKIKNDIDNGIGRGYVKEVRGMRTHLDEYVKGKGKIRDKYIYVSPDNSCVTDASSSLILGGEYMLGGRINLRKAVLLFRKHKPEIDKLCQKYLSEIFSS